MIRRSKAVFDAIDTDGSGSISARELRNSMSGQEFAGAAVQAFRAMDVDGSDSLTFDEMLRVLYPQAKENDLKLMVREVSGLPVDETLISELQIRFENLDDDFDAKHILKDIVESLKEDDIFAKYMVNYTPSAKLLNKPIGFQTFLTELFGTTHKAKMGQILAWSKNAGPVHALDAKQQSELETLFALYDKDQSGTITMGEMRQHFDGLGFAQGEVDKLFSKYDQSGDKTVDLVEFKKFYRTVWNSASRNRSVDGSTSTYRPTTLEQKRADAAAAEKQLDDEYR